MLISLDDDRLHLRATDVAVTDDELTVALEDGRSVSVPLAWYPRLLHGTRKQRNNFEIGHFGIHWPDLDEDLSIKGLLLGNKSGESQESLKRWMSYHKLGKKVPVKEQPLPAWAQKSLRPGKKARPTRRRAARK